MTVQIARDTKGVSEVKDMIEVRESPTSGEAPDIHRRLGVVIDDAGITMHVKRSLLESERFRGLLAEPAALPAAA